tara:strand:- start:3704 stop:5467 length:1764 start_codon:yes stop_codon:yes gene_type:complete
VATRKISDLTLLTTVSPSDTLLLLDNSDPVDTNKKSEVGSIFKAVPGGSQNQPGLAFDQKTATGFYSTTQGELGISLGDSKLLLEKQSTSLVLSARDSADSNLDLTLQALGTGLIRFNSTIAINDSVFTVPNSSDNSKIIKFSATQLPTATTRTFVFPDAGVDVDTLVTTSSTQTLTSKTLVSPIFSGDLTGANLTLSGNIQVDGNSTIGSDNNDTLTVAAVTTLNANVTANNPVTINATTTATDDITLNQVSSTGTYKKLKFFDTSQDTNAGRDVGDLSVSTDQASRYLDLQYYDRDTDYSSTNHTYGMRVASIGYTMPDVLVQITNGAISGFVITDPGANITQSLTAVITGDGSDALVTPVVVNGALSSITIDAGGQDYTSATIEFTTTGGALQYRTYNHDSNTETRNEIIHTGNLSLISAIGSVNNLVTTGSVNFDDGTFILDEVNDRVGIDITPSAYKLEVGGDIYFTGGQLIGGDSSAFVLQRRLDATPIKFNKFDGTTEMMIDSNGRVGINKIPTKQLDITGDSNVDGDFYVTETDSVNQIGGAIHAKRLKLEDLKGAVQTITADTISATSRTKVIFHAYS